MKTCLVLCLTVLAVSLTQASMTYRQLLQLSKPADDSVKADHKIQFGELDDEVDFQGILNQMGHDFRFEESKDGKNNIELGDFASFKTTDGNNADLDESVKAGDCACSGKECVCCCTLTFTYEGKQYYLVLCCRITYIRSSYFKVELFFQYKLVRSVYVSSPTIVDYRPISALTVGCKIDEVSSSKICFFLYFVVSGKIYPCERKCLVVSSSRFGMNLEKSDD